METTRGNDDLTVGAFIREETNDGDILHVLGEVDLANAGAFEKAAMALQNHATPIVIDLTGCTYMDSSGLRVLAAMHKAVDGHIRVVVPQTGSVHRIFEITGLGQQFNACNTVDQAFSKPESPPR